MGGLDANSVVVTLVAALTAGAAMFGLNAVDPSTRPLPASEWLTASFIATINSRFLLAAVGIEKF